MALQKVVQTPYGVEANYHKIALTSINWHEKRAHIEVLSFKDALARQDGKMPLGAFALDFEGETFDYIFNDNVVGKTYAKIKAKEEFADSIDC